MSQGHLFNHLDTVAARFRQLRLSRTLTTIWLVAAACAAVIWLWVSRTGNSAGTIATVVVIGGAVLAAFSAWLASTSRRDYSWLAHRVEAAFPELRTSLLAAIQQRPDLPGGQFGYLQLSVIKQALSHANGHFWPDVVSQRTLNVAAAANIGSFLLFTVMVIAIAITGGPAAGSIAPEPPALDRFEGGFTVSVEPGDVEVEKGSSLLVLARVTGRMPAEATLHYEPTEEAGQNESKSLAMAASLADPVFGARIPSVDKRFAYHITLAGTTTPTYYVDVFEYPRLEKADALLEYPAYTSMQQRLVQDVRTLSVPEGTQLTLKCTLNKAVASAVLHENANETELPPIALKATGEDSYLYEAKLVCEQSRKLSLELIDEQGRKNTKPILFTINVLPNQPPDLKPTFPARDLEISALEELTLQSTVWDDFGLKRQGMSYSLAGAEPVDVILAEDASPKERHELAYVVRMEDLNAEPDQLLSYFWWAEDIGPDGKLRRTESDMYFAEVRPFEEIFRQGEQPPGGQAGQQQGQQGQGQNAQQAQQLAQLQKDIINATWKLIRREIGSSLTPSFAADAEHVHLSQSSALEQATKLAEELQDEQSQEYAAEVLNHMESAIEHLKAAYEGPDAEPLKSALPAEQAAYSSLLKLRSREHEVIRQQQQQGQQGAQTASRSQQQRQQMEQLDLNEEENRYETQTAAREQQQESPADRENRQVLNRLRELARRQEDLNERLKELQSALEEAQTEKEQEEIRKQLKRLQEEQQQILEDTDQLQNRLQSPENSQQMEEQREQLEETREQVRRAAEALDNEEVSQAAASGTRAQQQFEDLREEFRRRAANRFSEEMQQMKETARELDEREKALAEQLKDAVEPQEKSLRADDPMEKIAEQFREQRERLTELQNQMRDTIQEAEETEPLLSSRLYDAARNAQDQKLDRALEAAERSVRRGFIDDAQQLEGAARKSIEQLREGIDKAAEGVLGDETEALRRARDELQQLARELQEEIRRNTGEEAPADAQQSQANSTESRNELNGARPSGVGTPQQRAQRSEQEPNEQEDFPADDQQRQPGAPSGEGTQQRLGNAGSNSSQQPSGQRSTEAAQPMSQGQQRDGQQEPQSEMPGRGPGSPMLDDPMSEQGPQPTGQQSTDENLPGSGQERSDPSEQNSGSPSAPPGEQQGEQPAAGEEGQQQAARSGQAGSQEDAPDRARQPRRLGETSSNQSQGPRSEQAPGGPGGTRGGARPDAAPIAGDDYREWSDRLRDVEEMVTDPELRAEAARIRERAREVRAELKRDSAEPQWDLVRIQVSDPLVELESRVARELLRRSSKKALVPLDRDPVPPQYSEKIRRYYERLGSGQ